MSKNEVALSLVASGQPALNTEFSRSPRMCESVERDGSAVSATTVRDAREGC